MSAVDKDLFPQIIADLDFYHVHSSADLAYRLRTLQRVAAAAIGVYLYYCYQPLLTSQMSHIPNASNLVTGAFFLIGYTLCSPAVFLVFGIERFCSGGAQMISGVVNKKIARIAMGSLHFFGGYGVFQMYRKYDLVSFYLSPNLLDSLFKRVANRYAPPLWDRFYKK
ncbi:MAG TPA: hypothetical protein VIJ14_04180 [Rhabdochlamydiaceae bacterium]